MRAAAATERRRRWRLLLRVRRALRAEVRTACAAMRGAVMALRMAMEGAHMLQRRDPVEAIEAS